jgi:hypothetical protein
VHSACVRVAVSGASAGSSRLAAGCHRALLARGGGLSFEWFVLCEHIAKTAFTTNRINSMT